MKLFKRLMTALLAGVLAVGMLAGCSSAPVEPGAPLPSDEEALALYQGVAETCTRYNVKTPVYTAELDQIARNIAEGTTIGKWYNDTPKAVIDKAKTDVAALAEGAEYINYDLNLYDTTVKNPLGTTALKNDILSKGANRVGFAIATMKDAKGNDVKYACIVYARYPDAAAQN